MSKQKLVQMCTNRRKEKEMLNVNVIGDRIAKIDSGVQWKNYTALSGLSIVAGIKRTTLETRVFGKDTPSSDFRRAYARGKQLVGHGANVGLGKEKQAEIRTMGIDDAVTAMLDILSKHMTALGAANAKDYDAKREYATAEDMPKADPEADAAMAADTPADTPVADTPPAETPAATPPTVADLMAIMTTMAELDRIALAQFLLSDPAVAAALQPTEVRKAA
jgi:hypothetical protein